MKMRKIWMLEQRIQHRLRLSDKRGNFKLATGKFSLKDTFWKPSGHVPWRNRDLVIYTLIFSYNDIYNDIESQIFFQNNDIEAQLFSR